MEKSNFAVPVEVRTIIQEAHSIIQEIRRYIQEVHSYYI